jgi:hypothetical protein
MVDNGQFFFLLEKAIDKLVEFSGELLIFVFGF